MKKTTKTGQAEMKLLAEGSWQRKLSDAKAKGMKDLRSIGKLDDEFDVSILAPFQMRGNGLESTALAAVLVEHDWKYMRRMQMVDWGRKLINEAYFLGTLTEELPSTIAKAIQGDLSDDEQKNQVNLVEQRTKGDMEIMQLKSELNEWYVQFEGMHKRKGAVLTAMKQFSSGEPECWKLYRHRGKEEDVPLPYAIRNSINHHNPNNEWSIAELRTAVELLRKWVSEP